MRIAPIIRITVPTIRRVTTGQSGTKRLGIVSAVTCQFEWNKTWESQTEGKLNHSHHKATNMTGLTLGGRNEMKKWAIRSPMQHTKLKYYKYVNSWYGTKVTSASKEASWLDRFEQFDWLLQVCL